MPDPIVPPAPAADPVVPPITDPVTDPVTDPPIPPTDADRSRAGYDQRKTASELAALREENQGYKRREEQARLAALSEKERQAETNRTLAAENAALRAETLRTRIAAEMGLPSALSARLIGTDEAAIRADATELLAFVPKGRAGSATAPVTEPKTTKTYSRAELQADPALARSPEVLQAYKEGRITG